MEKLRTYLNGMPLADQSAFADRCGTTIGYLRKAISTSSKLDGKTCIAIERESAGRVHCEDLRPDADWAYLRNSVAASPAGEAANA